MLYMWNNWYDWSYLEKKREDQEGNYNCFKSSWVTVMYNSDACQFLRKKWIKLGPKNECDQRVYLSLIWEIYQFNLSIYLIYQLNVDKYI